MNGRPTSEEDSKRVLLSARINPSTLRFLKTIRAKNLGRSIDALVVAHQAFMTAMRNRLPIEQRLRRQPARLDLTVKK